MSSFRLAFDIGYRSIGWAVLEGETPLACGAVTFPADDCLASKRRQLRRQRRHIRSTRQRVARLKWCFLVRNLVPEDHLDGPGHPAPFSLAARVLAGGPLLTWLELWHVLRWYAHNRGYDGNRAWASGDQQQEDTEKEAHAWQAMQRLNTYTMAETVCRLVEIDPFSDQCPHSSPYKTYDMAFPRHIVTGEVQKILESHIHELPGIDQGWINAVMDDARAAGPVEPKLPPRYTGGILFGQLKPRFDNRIIGKCPFTNQNLPSRQNMDFLRYRWAMILKNLRSDGLPLTPAVRQELDTAMKEQGHLTPTELRREVERLTGSDVHNVREYFEIHPDSKDALVLDPAETIYQGKGPGSRDLQPLWKTLSPSIQKRALSRWKKDRPVTPRWMLEELQVADEDLAPLEKGIETLWSQDQRKSRSRYSTRDHLLDRRFGPKKLSGRAPYSREILRKVYEEVLKGWDPQKPSRSAIHPDGEEKPEHGAIYRTAEVIDAERSKPLAKLTNNHLIRHRLLLLGGDDDISPPRRGLIHDLIDEFCDGDPSRIGSVVVEVNRDLQEFSGMTQKEITSELNGRLRQFKEAIKLLEDNGLPITGTLIRKARIALDMNRTCPFTGQKYDVYQLPDLQFEHIIPRSLMPSDALHAQVLTFLEVNSLKKNRTAVQFIRDCGGENVGNLSVLPYGSYEALVKGLNLKGHPEDQKRKKRRQELLLVESYQPRESAFIPSQLTQSSHLVRLAARRIEKVLPHLVQNEAGETISRVISLPGQITGFVRKGWRLDGCLSAACPEVLDADGKAKPKDDIRSITHLHHALDAVVLGLSMHYFPRDGGVWEKLLRRKLSPTDQAILKARCKLVQFTDKGGPWLKSLPNSLKNQIRQCLAESRVVQHVPADRSGVHAELNTWGIRQPDSKTPRGMVPLQQRSTEVKNHRRIRTRKKEKEAASRLLGLNPPDGTGKLATINGVLVISDNYGVALDPFPEVIPFHQVSRRLEELKEKNGGRPVRVLRKGMLIKLCATPKSRGQDYSGIWRIASVKNKQSGIALTFVHPAYVKAKDRVNWSGVDIRLSSLQKSGLTIVRHSLAGINLRQI